MTSPDPTTVLSTLMAYPSSRVNLSAKLVLVSGRDAIRAVPPDAANTVAFDLSQADSITIAKHTHHPRPAGITPDSAAFVGVLQSRAAAGGSLYETTTYTRTSPLSLADLAELIQSKPQILDVLVRPQQLVVLSTAVSPAVAPFRECLKHHRRLRSAGGYTRITKKAARSRATRLKLLARALMP